MSEDALPETGIRAPAAASEPWPRIRSWRDGIRRNIGLSDVAAVLVLVMATWHLVARNGGRDPGDMLWVLGAAAVGVLVLVGTLRRTSRGFLWLFTAWSFAPLITLLDAEIRAGAVRPLTALALAPAVALATIHLWRRPWGPAALGAIVALAAMRSWYLTFFAWWGGAMGRPTWLALSWHNQSGTLMGALGVAATAAAAVLWTRTHAAGNGARPIRGAVLVAGVIAGPALAGAWLSGSRGAVIASGMGLAAVVLGLARGGALKRATPALAGVLLAATVVVVGLESMVRSDAGQPLAARDHSAIGNLSERFGYWEAAVGMAKSRPLTGWGPGSYRWASVPHYPDATGLSSSAHNEYLEVLAESGLVGAGPVWLAAIAMALLTGAAILRRSFHADNRHAGALAAAGAVVVLGVHAGLDFDWDYPLLLALLVMGGAVLWAGRSDPTPDGQPALYPAAGPVLTAAAAGGALLLCGAAIAGAVGSAHGHPAWELNRPLAGSMAAARAGDLPTARAHIATARRWNPGAPSLPAFAAIVEHHAGTITDSTLAAAVDRGMHAADHLLVATRLYISGNPPATRAILDDLVPLIEARRRRERSDLVVQVADLQLRTEAALSGCDAAAAMAGPVGAWVESFTVPAGSVNDLLISVGKDIGCDLRDAVLDSPTSS
jgi:O-antigen ligase